MSRLKRLSVLASVVRGDAKVLWHALRHPASPAWFKLGTIGLVAYVLSPADFVPDLIPFVGVLDDIVLVPLAIAFLLRRLPPTVRADARRKAGLPPEPTAHGETIDMR